MLTALTCFRLCRAFQGVPPYFLSVKGCSGGAARAKAMLVDRLTVAEDRLMVLSHQDTMEDLVQAKLRLAQADYVLLEKQVCIEECMC